MTRAPAPPEHLSAPARAAWHRIYAFLANRNEWDDLYVFALEIASSQCALYLVAAREPGADPALVEKIRLQARQALSEMHYIPAERINLATLTPDGLDAEISAVCALLSSSTD